MMPLIRVGDVSMSVTEVGHGEALVLLHGFTGSGRDWAPHREVLARRYRTIAVDLLGHGRSDSPADPARYRMERCVANLAELLDTFAVERFMLLGYSMGGRVALAFALTHPKRVRALVLEGASPGLADLRERQVRAAQDEALADRIERDGVGAFADTWMRRPLFASQARLGPQILAAERAARCANSPVGLVNCLRGMGTGAQEPLWDRLPALAMPVLLVAGEEDGKFRGIASAMAVRLRKAEVAVIPQAGHNTHLENPEAFRKRVTEFLGGKAVCDKHSAVSSEAHSLPLLRAKQGAGERPAARRAAKDRKATGER